VEAIVIQGLSAGILTVILCSTDIAEPLRRWVTKPLHCPICTSFWASLAFDFSPTCLATMGVANITILLTHWSMTTYGDEDGTPTTETEDFEGTGSIEHDQAQ
jgi:hypothetical protein